LEYAPLINARAHVLRAASGATGGLKTTPIQNMQFREQYMRFLNFLLYRVRSLADMKSSHKMAAVYYLLLQDRIDEARILFSKITAKAVKEDGKADGSEHDSVLQYDYLTAYLDFFNPTGPTKALAIAKKYKNYPIIKKRQLFEDVEQHLLEAQPNAVSDVKVGVAAVSRDREMQNLAATEPSLDFSIESQKIEIAYQNIKKCTVNFYRMDIELLFSTNPFIKDDSSNLVVSPNFSIPLDKLPENKSSVSVDVPEQFRNANVYVEVLGAGASRCKTYYSNSLNVQVINNVGQVKVHQKANNAPIAMAYIKVYARNNDSSVAFYKDGYTDRRGAFDYASLSTNKLKDVQNFSILVMTEEFGAVVREADKPST
jgi:hypothetical protein